VSDVIRFPAHALENDIPGEDGGDGHCECEIVVKATDYDALREAALRARTSMMQNTAHSNEYTNALDALDLALFPRSAPADGEKQA
jgi:hypothetical protein